MFHSFDTPHCAQQGCSFNSYQAGMTQSQPAGAAISKDIVDIQQLETALFELHGKMRCLRRALAIMTLLTGLATAGFCYCTVFLPDFPQRFARFLMEAAVECCCALGIASLICLFAFSALHFLYRNELLRKRELRRQHLIGH